MNVAVAESDAWSVAVKTYGPPGVPDGIVYRHENWPDAFVVEALHTLPETCGQVTLSAELAANPEPVRVTTVPAGPWFGLITSDVETVNEAVAACPNESVAVNK